MPVTRPALPSRYATPELIASGGMGEVYRATDDTLGRTVAVKVLSGRWAADEEFHARFLREARTAASLSGEPNVIAIYDVGESRDGSAVHRHGVRDGGRLPIACEEGALPPAPGAAAGSTRLQARSTPPTPVASCTATSNRRTCSSRDGRVRVSDFGIARAADHDTLTAHRLDPGLGWLHGAGAGTGRVEPRRRATGTGWRASRSSCSPAGVRSNAKARRRRRRPMRRDTTIGSTSSTRVCRPVSTPSSRGDLPSGPRSGMRPAPPSSAICARRWRLRPVDGGHGRQRTVAARRRAVHPLRLATPRRRGAARCGSGCSRRAVRSRGR